MRIRGALFALLMVVAVVAMTTPAALAQDNCQEFRALMQGRVVQDPLGSLPPGLASHKDEFGWGGDVFSTVGNDGTFLGGWFYGKDDETSQSIYGRRNGRGTKGLYMYEFGTYDPNAGTWDITDSFDIQLGEAVWTIEPGGAYAGSYKASGKMINGTGRFAGATGSFTLHGEFGVWSTDTNPWGFVSAWNPVLTGKFCK
jgi:hypothetical protein